MDNMQYDRVDDKQFEEEYVNIQLRSDGFAIRIPIKGMPEEVVKLAHALKALLESNRAERQRFMRCQSKGKDFNFELDGEGYTMQMPGPEATEEWNKFIDNPPFKIPENYAALPNDLKLPKHLIEDLTSNSDPKYIEATLWLWAEMMHDQALWKEVTEKAYLNESYKFEYKGRTTYCKFNIREDIIKGGRA